MRKRYICGMGFTCEDKLVRIIHDKVEDKEYYLFADICKIMNEQQVIIDGLKEKLCELGVSDVKINGKRINTGLEEWLE